MLLGIAAIIYNIVRYLCHTAQPVFIGLNWVAFQK